MDQNLEAVIVNVLYSKSVPLLQHSLQTAEIAATLTGELLAKHVPIGCSQRFAYEAGLLHDIGKIYVSEAILDKPASLTEREHETIRLHTSWGRHFVETIGLDCYALVVANHHENATGTGYPRGLSSPDLDPITRVVRIADMLSALISDRPYRRGVLDDDFILASLDSEIEGLFDDTADIIKHAVTTYLFQFRRLHRKTILNLPLVQEVPSLEAL